MTENQYQRANRMVLITILIVFGFIAVTVLAALGVSKGEQPGRIIIQFITALVVMTASIAAYIMKKKTHICEVLLSVNIAIGYVVVVLLNSTDTVWTYGIPMIISVMVYLNKRLMYCANGLVILANIVRLIKDFDTVIKQGISYPCNHSCDDHIDQYSEYIDSVFWREGIPD